jgi:lipopolysaccharide export LptBFGC system permease protein LptF
MENHVNYSAKSILKNEITLGQAVGFLITIIIVVVSNWISTQVSITKIEVRQNIQEERAKEDREVSEKNQKMILDEVKELNRKLSSIEIELTNKQNRP